MRLRSDAACLAGAVAMLATALVCAALPGAASAAPKGKPGLWETNVRNPEIDRMRAQMAQQMAQMPPAQRAQMEAMMGNMGIGGFAGTGAMQMCLTPEMVQQDMPAAFPENCKGSWNAKGSTISFRYSCADGSSGSGEITYSGDTAYVGWTEALSQGRKMRMETSGRWLSADCGKVKPIPLPSR